MAAGLVEVRGLVIIHQNGAGPEVVARGIDLEMGPRERVALIGPAGAGKSGVLRVLAGQEAPAAGRVVVAGHDLSRMSSGQRARYRRDVVGWLRQPAESGLWPSLTVIENVQVPMLASGTPAGRREAAADLLEALRLATRASDRTPSLSVDERRRLAVAVALANGPRLLLADDLTAGLDEATASDLLTDVCGVARQHDAALLLTSHAAGMTHVDRVVRLGHGHA